MSWTRAWVRHTPRTYADLSAQTADLPVQGLVLSIPPAPPAVANATNSMAIGSFVCGLLQIFSFGLTAVPAVILGHAARRQIRRTGEQGDGFALTGLVLGWLGITFVALLVIGMAVAVVSATRPG
jgi:hypothetical protein